MHKLFICLVLSAATLAVKAQTQAVQGQPAPLPIIQQYGKVDQADLEMKACDFEKDANAMVLFSKADVYYDDAFNISADYHKRIKIFNDNGKDEANIRIEFYGGDRSEYIGNIQAETINMVDGKMEITKLDKKLIYVQHLDKQRDVYIFSMPNVKAGSIIEYKYQWNTPNYYNFPDWYFQEKIPVRYSELTTEIPEMLYFKTEVRTREPFVKNTTASIGRSTGLGADAVAYNCAKDTKAMAYIHSLPDEPFMSSFADNLQCIIYELTSVRPLGGFQRTYSGTWDKIGRWLADHEDFGSQIKRKVDNEEAIITRASALKTDDQKIAFLFDTVRNAMKWNGQERFLTNDGTSKAWEA